MTTEAVTALVTAVFAGLTALLATFGGLVAGRAQRADADRVELRESRRYGLAADRWIFVLERELARRGHPLPPGRPAELDGPVPTDDAKR